MEKNNIDTTIFYPFVGTTSTVRKKIKWIS